MPLWTGTAHRLPLGHREAVQETSLGARCFLPRTPGLSIPPHSHPNGVQDKTRHLKFYVLNRATFS